jgi:hypothetical protein
VLTIRASRPDSLGACLAAIPVAGERFMRGRLVRLLNRVVGPTGFSYACIGLSAGPLVGPAPFGACRKGRSIMATATVERGSRNRLSPEQIAERKQAAALAELRRNGVDLTKPVMEERRAHSRAVIEEWGLDHAGGEYEMPPIAPLPTRPNFKSRADATPMGRDDVANVTFLNIDTAREILNEVAAVAPEIAKCAIAHVERQWRDLLTESERYTLSAMAARKFMREGVPV